MEEQTGIQKETPSDIVAPPKDDSLVVIASTPGQMANAQLQLKFWFEQKVTACKTDLAECEENLALAKSRKWQTRGWSNRVVRARQALEYYMKGLAAIEAGYCIVPDFPVEIIAIRTTASSPRRNMAENHHWTPAVASQITNSPALGEGEYVSPVADTRSFSYDKQLAEGKTEKRYVAEATEFVPPDFPYKLVKPRILEETNKAMALKIFDEICAVKKPPRAPDPIVVGRIKRRVSGYDFKTISFMVAWWIDVKDL